MNEYTVYWIKGDFSYHYFHKADILYRFIKAYEENKDREDLFAQYYHITNYFPRTPLISHIKAYHEEKDIDVTIEIKYNTLKIYGVRQSISLYIFEKHLTVYCETLNDAEVLLFPALRTFHESLFIKGNSLGESGWISPKIKKAAHKKGQVLYSHL